ncbi:hypothetical protein [Microbulbifer sp. ALW1]|uniref:hypothetical protein n=1 Tax=Microbulbifer sp. (strain ALW1) TaxID=1516059 RepID=UPI00135CE8D7|nr:hypothetical protein [Microbulbifer sp. ALW1]
MDLLLKESLLGILLVRRTGAFKLLSVMFFLCFGVPAILKANEINAYLCVFTVIVFFTILFHFSFNHKVLVKDLRGDIFISFSPFPLLKTKVGNVRNALFIGVQEGGYSRLSSINEYGGRAASGEMRWVYVAFRGNVKKYLVGYFDSASRQMASSTAKALSDFLNIKYIKGTEVRRS